MTPAHPFLHRPTLFAVGGPNGAGKTTFYEAHLSPAGLRCVSADVLARQLDLEPYLAAQAADAVRRTLLAQGESFIFETVFSDPVGDKLAFLQKAVSAGYDVTLFFIGIASPQLCEERVAMRLSQGGHDVPFDKIASRYPRTLVNLKAAIASLPHVLVFDNSDLARPFRRVAEYRSGNSVAVMPAVPDWFQSIL